MGWSIRKSFKFGAFRINLSNSGVSGSFGVKGARISVGKRGTYVNLGANGIYYRQRINNGRKPNPQVQDSSTEFYDDQGVDGLTDMNSKDFIEDLQSKFNQKSLLIWIGIIPSYILMIVLLVYLFRPISTNKTFDTWFTITKKSVHIRDSPSIHATVLTTANAADRFRFLERTKDDWIKLSVSDSTFGFAKEDLGVVSTELSSVEIIRPFQESPKLRQALVIASMALLVIYCVWLARFEKKRKTLEVYYQMDDGLQNLHQQFLKCFEQFALSNRIWSMLDTEVVTEQKYHAGASELVSRANLTLISSDRKPAAFLKTNVQIPLIRFGRLSWYFFPERLVMEAQGKFAALQYRNINVSINNVRFIETDAVAKDASIVDYTWKYLNKNGGPDQRFADNRQLPICLYTQYNFRSEEGLNKTLITSKTGAMDSFVSFINAIGVYQSRLSPI